MLDVARAEALIREHLIPLETVRCRLDLAAGSVLAEDIVADRDQPPMDRVTMDGIAIRHQSWREGRRNFRILGTQAAGQPAVNLGDDQGCFEVMTGSCLPAGCDCVIPVERIQRDGEHARLAVEYEPERGQFIHPRGSDYSRRRAPAGCGHAAAQPGHCGPRRNRQGCGDGHATSAYLDHQYR